MSDASELYDRDYQAWAQRQIELLSTRHFADLDIAHLFEELADMGRSERSELENRLVVLLAHLLSRLWDRSEAGVKSPIAASIMVSATQILASVCHGHGVTRNEIEAYFNQSVYRR